jgi:hypothetical protein
VHHFAVAFWNLVNYWIEFAALLFSEQRSQRGDQADSRTDWRGVGKESQEEGKEE